MRLMLLPLLLGAACGPPLNSAEVFGLEPSPRAWVYGTVSNAETSGPVADVTVQFASASTRTDGNGAFRIVGLSPTDGEVAASREGFETLALALTLRAGGNRLDLRMAPLACGTCRQDEVCDPAKGACVLSASLSGDVVDACTGAAVEAKVTVDGRSTCSVSIKGYWKLTGLRPGGPQTIAVGRAGYQAFSRQLTLVSGFNALDKMELVPIGGCSAPAPGPAACSCTTMNCQ